MPGTNGLAYLTGTSATDEKVFNNIDPGRRRRRPVPLRRRRRNVDTAAGAGNNFQAGFGAGSGRRFGHDVAAEFVAGRIHRQRRRRL
jgi:hypothetical protein